MNVHAATISRTVERKGNMRSASPIRHTVERTLGSVADTLSRRNQIAARCELCNEALEILVTLCYEKDDQGQYINVDPISGQILIPMPCGWRRYRDYGLRRSEADTIRFALRYWQQTERFPLFEYIDYTTRWCVNIDPYSNVSAARGWLSAHPVTPNLWRMAHDSGDK